jgi:hypothetical protein
LRFPIRICSISGLVAAAFSPITLVSPHLAPAADGVAEAQDLALDQGAAGLLLLDVVAGKKTMPTAMWLSTSRTPLSRLLKKACGILDVDAGAIAGLASALDGAPMPDGLQGVDAGDHHLAARLAVDGDDAAHAAGVPLEVHGPIALALELRPLAPIECQPGRVRDVPHVPFRMIRAPRRRA